MPIQLWAHSGHPGPNPLKPAILLEELKKEYTVKAIPFGPEGVKGPEFTKLNPNGRVPAILDQENNNFVVWESGAILHYLCNKYDSAGKYSGSTPEEKAIVDEWLCLQLSGLGPVQGNVNWFKHYHEKTHGEKAGDSVVKRFRDETERIYGIMEKQLEAQEQQGSKFLALDRLTIADIANHVWLRMEHYNDFGSLQSVLKKFPKLSAYVERLEALESTKAANKKLEASYA